MFANLSAPVKRTHSMMATSSGSSPVKSSLLRLLFTLQRYGFWFKRTGCSLEMHVMQMGRTIGPTTVAMVGSRQCLMKLPRR